MYVATIIVIFFISSSYAREDLIVSACEDEYIDIRCTKGQKIIIQKAIYCYHATNACCGSDYTSDVIAGICNNKSHCHLTVNKRLFENRCYKNENNLTIYYTCEDLTPEETCNKKCRQFEEWSNCASMCPAMCRNEFKENVVCPALCIDGCKCIEGYIIDPYTSKCIPEQYCPTKGKKNERFSRCHADLQRYCPLPVEHITTKAPRNCKCVPGYVCKKKYFRNSSKECVKLEECPNLKG